MFVLLMVFLTTLIYFVYFQDLIVILHGVAVPLVAFIQDNYNQTVPVELFSALLVIVGYLFFSLLVSLCFILGKFWYAVSSGRRQDFQREYYSVRGGLLVKLLPLLLIAVKFFESYSVVLGNLLLGYTLVAFVPAFWAGSSLIHCVSAQKPDNAGIRLFLVYAVLFLFGQLILPLIFLGWLDSLVDVRKRFLKQVC